MTADPLQIAVVGSWVATAIGVGMWLWCWTRPCDALRRIRLNDAGIVLVFAAVIVRLIVQQRPMSAIDWALALLAPIFIGAALWRLGRTG